MIAPILFIGLLFNFVFNFTDLTIVYLLTQVGRERHGGARQLCL
jgi:ABC-type sugar transport system permease subunit